MIANGTDEDLIEFLRAKRDSQQIREESADTSDPEVRSVSVYFYLSETKWMNAEMPFVNVDELNIFQCNHVAYKL